LDRREKFAGYGRLALFLITAVVGLSSIRVPWLHPAWTVLPFVAFVVMLIVHGRIKRAWFRAARAVAFYDAGLARLRDEWQGKGQQGTRFADEKHPYAADLDLFGPGSLFELLCTARTRTGEDTLAAWLKAGAPPAEVRQRQQAVAELSGMLDLREDLALLGSDVPAGVDFDAVAAWGEGEAILPWPWLRWVALTLGMAALVGLVGGLMALTGGLDETTAFGRFFLDGRVGTEAREREQAGQPATGSYVGSSGFWSFGAVLIVNGVFSLCLSRRVGQVLSVVERRSRDLAMLANVLARLEEARFTSSLLTRLHVELTEGTGAPPSQRIAQLSNLIDTLNSRRNPLFSPVAYLMLWGTQMAFAIESWRATTGRAIRRWLAIVGQIEALCALGGYAAENPQDVYPDVVDQGPVYDGEGLSHPLLPHGKCIPNDVALGAVRVLIVSGSNMSGKSTLLRTVGINAVLALAGSPVRARRLRLSPLNVGATLRIQDSLQAGRSRFYAEILRVRQVVDLSRGSVPLLFLLDEIFAGTNSHDRWVGAEAVVKGLADAGAVGLVTTHDLTLTRIVEELGERASNVHFADHFEDGVMTFDYRLHPGVVQKSNALALMRAVGLEV
jgi:hypothetical protein